MATDLYGGSYVDSWDYARKIITLGAKLPFYKLVSEDTENGVSLELYIDEFGYFRKNMSDLDVPGFYVIYEKTPNSQTCLYVGSSLSSVSYRIYRYAKELRDKSRKDENHPGAAKARRAGISPDNIYIKYIPMSDLPVVQSDFIDLETLDETLAIMLKSRFNTKRKI